MEKNSKIGAYGGKKYRRYRGFTIAELIVIIGILAILAVVGFVMLSGYLRDGRNSAKAADMNSIGKSVEIYAIEQGGYPEPDEFQSITYSGGLVWKQGTFGSGTHQKTKLVNKAPVDPDSGNFYSYSTTASRQEYQLGTGIQGELVETRPFFEAAYAASMIEGTAYTVGNYNGVVARSVTGTSCDILIVPSIITNKTGAVVDFTSLAQNDGLVFERYKNLPATYAGSNFKTDGGFPFIPGTLTAYHDENGCLDLSSSGAAMAGFVQKIQTAYGGSVLAENEKYAKYATVEINLSSPSKETLALANDAIGFFWRGSKRIATAFDSPGGETYPDGGTAASPPEEEVVVVMDEPITIGMNSPTGNTYACELCD